MILIVEDSESIGSLLKRFCERMGYDCEHHTTWEAAHSSLEQNPAQYKVAMVDLTLEGGQADGKDALRWLSANQPHIQGVVMSGAVVEATDHIAPNLLILNKPFALSDVKNILVEALQT